MPRANNRINITRSIYTTVYWTHFYLRFQSIWEGGTRAMSTWSVKPCSNFQKLFRKVESLGSMFHSYWKLKLKMVKILFRDVGALTVVDTLTITLFSAPKLAGKVLLILPFNSGHFFFFFCLCVPLGAALFCGPPSTPTPHTMII